MIQDNRDGAYNLTYNRVVTNPVSIVNELLGECKVSLYITDGNFDQKITQLVKDAIYDFERMTATSVASQTINLRYEYFKGKNKLPFPPHTSASVVLPIGTEYEVSGLNVKYIEGGTGKPINIEVQAGYSVLPENIKAVLIKMVEAKFKNETLAKDYPSSLFAEIKSFAQHID